MSPLLAIRDLSIVLDDGQGRMPIVADMAFDLEAGETLGVVGESGSGKSLLALALIGLLPGGAQVSGSIRFDGEELVGRDEDAYCQLRGSRIAMIFQEPMTALNPSMRVGDQIAEGLRLGGMDREAARERALNLLDRVRITDARQRMASYPHELSGGQRQRVMIAIALARNPALLIADEPTTALDTTVQAEILDILAELVADLGMALILVSHDLGVIARATRRTLVMYAGTRFEDGATAEILGTPRNPYTQALLAARPARRTAAAEVLRPRPRLAAIPGVVPAYAALPPGCRFADRCARRIAACDDGEPAWRELSDGRGVRCLRAGEQDQGA
ncbi:ABC transporter ATP-binding protein [Consotaella aegiceratis]|uniref:ABC transporter ATP-binding protein n=1 Tax=Consotaella aegiceratis TaxID=3097961 RepID=UPI002F3F9287